MIKYLEYESRFGSSFTLGARIFFFFFVANIIV